MHEEKKRKKLPKLTIALSILTVIAIGASVYFYLLYSGTQSQATKQQQVVDKIAKAVELPGEAPTVVTVADKTRLTNKQLADKVDNGDMILVFAQAKRLVIYRPSIAKVTNMLTFANTAELSSGTSSASKR